MVYFFYSGQQAVCQLLTCPTDVEPIWHPEVHVIFRPLLQAFLHQLQQPFSSHHTLTTAASSRNGEKPPLLF